MTLTEFPGTAFRQPDIVTDGKEMDEKVVQLATFFSDFEPLFPVRWWNVLAES